MSTPNGRLRFISFLVILASLALIARLYFVQIVSGSSYREKAERQYTAPTNYFDRGSIFFSTKTGELVPAATIESGFIIALNTKLLEQDKLDATYEQINPIFPLDKESFLARASKLDDTYEEVAKRVPPEAAEQLEKLKIPGVSLVRERWRVYPGGEVAAHTIGLIGYQGDELSGRYGLERYYENVLGRNGDGAFINFFAEIFSNIKKGLSESKALEGDVVTTIEPTVQSYLEASLKKVNEKYSAEFTGAIVIDPQSGEIYAMALSPSFDPNNPQNEENSAVFRNKFVEDRYEMGSIIKPLTLAAGIDTGVLSAKTTYNDPGCMTLNKKTFCNYDGKSHGTAVTMQEVLSESLNTGIAKAVSLIGNRIFSDYMFQFGLDKLTGIDLPNEGVTLVSNLKTNRDLEYAQAGFGQGIALTPIVTVRAMSALANGGTLITPHLIKEVRYKIGGTNKIEFPKEEVRTRVIKKETSEEISRMLTVSVDHVLREGTVRLDGYSVAAKTGTAQIANPDGGGYYADKFLHSFFGYFPSYDPKFLIFIYSHDPKNISYASETLTDTFMDMTKFLINYYNIPPDREVVPPPPSFVL